MGVLQPLVDARRSQGFAVKIVDVNDVYSQFGYGIFGPDAIRADIADAAQNMSVDHVLLGGGDSLDYLNYAGTGSRSFIPSFYERYPSAGITLVAPGYLLMVDVSGPNGPDGVPDLSFGRLPARTVQEAEDLVGKILAYDTMNYRGSQLC